jgi:hypothetical protein
MADRWRQISQLYHAALELPESERAAFLDDNVADAQVREEVASRLAGISHCRRPLE